ncbi:CIC11C00000005699 [Sungouiella intermedia]|uniref:non-specific serine/threonine protein kinase n=1 Tax=Sungouiella intermedia TaxID=45354 RepID=A0A1L0CUA7_9ASCO|nr:CIC11C00000005699 [[Candida] intermedia]
MREFHRFLSILLPFLLAVVVFASPRLERLDNDLIEEKQTFNDANQKILPLDLRLLSDWKLSDLLLVSDIDGNLHGVERNTGAFLWSLPIDEPLVQILKSESKIGEDNTESNLLWFVEPARDGSLYYFSPLYGLNKLPTSIKDLVMESPFSLSGDNKIYTGARKTSLYTINLNTGQIKSHFGASEEDECPVPNVYGTPRFASGGDSNIIMIGKTTYELVIHSKLDANLVWNVTYSQWGPNNIDNDLIAQHVQSIDNLYFTPFHDKSLLAINRNIGTPSWISKLPSLAVDVFDVFSRDGEYVVLPHPSKVLNDLQVHSSGNSDYGNNDLCFVNKTANGKEWFAMSFPNYPTLLKSAPVSQYQMALYRYENGLLDDSSVHHLSDFNVSLEDAEQFINGVHKVNHLGPENMYQPVSKFHKITPQIGDGSESQDAEPPVPTGGKLQQIPSLMDGILFPNTPDQVRVDVSTLDRDGNNLYEDTYSRSRVPSRLVSEDRIFDKIPQQKLSVFRRIAEDLLVMCTLLLFLLAFGKINQILKNKNMPSEKQMPDNLKSDASQDVSRDISGEAKEDSSEDTLTEKQTSHKKVTIVAPGDTLDTLLEETETIVGDLEISEKIPDDEDNDLLTTKKKRKRGSRGGRRGGKGKKSSTKDEDDYKLDMQDANKEVDEKSDRSDLNDEDDDADEPVEPIQTKSLVKNMIRPSTQLKKLQIDNNLVISDKILGYGSHGTVVYEGSFENRPVAVKRMLLDFYDIANHEVRLLQESDDHPNVVRYFCSQSSESEKFLYIALELCVCSLEDIIEKLRSYPKTLRIDISTYNEVLLQLASGLNYLHSLKIVHRDLKPQNILVGEVTHRNLKLKTTLTTIRLLISDFGLCKKLDADQSSFRATTQHAASGTSGWRAPELLLHHDLSEISPDTISSIGSTSRHSIKDGSQSNGQGKRLTKAIDIFSLGCVYYYILSGGGHPFGDRYLREGNIIRGDYNLRPLMEYCPHDYVEATDLIESMISFNPNDRPDTAHILKHPYFWTYSKKLEFLLKVSDRFEIERRDPPSDLLLCLELVGKKVHNKDWLSKFDSVFTDNLGKYRKYHTDKVMDLLRALRNKYHHYNDMPSDLQSQMSPLPHGFYGYFNSKFPRLLMEIYYIVRDNLKDEHLFQEYY